MLHVIKTYDLLFRGNDGEQEEMIYFDTAAMINAFSVLPFRDCRGNTLIDVAGGGRTFINTKIGPIKL